MRAIAGLLCILASILTAKANVEKTIFLGPGAIHLPNARPSVDDLQLDILEPVERSVLATQLSVQFPNEDAPRGLESWYILRDLEPGRRYEARICWPAFVSQERPLQYRVFGLLPGQCYSYASLFAC